MDIKQKCSGSSWKNEYLKYIYIKEWKSREFNSHRENGFYWENASIIKKIEDGVMEKWEVYCQNIWLIKVEIEMMNYFYKIIFQLFK